MCCLVFGHHISESEVKRLSSGLGGGRNGRVTGSEATSLPLEESGYSIAYV